MSSETSTETLAARGSEARAADSALEPWQLFTLAGLMGATVVVFVSSGQTPAGIILLSLTIFTAAIVGVAAWRTLAPFTQSDRRVGSAVLGGRTRAALEREKTLVLRAIKELEFDRAMGKISDKDFAEVSVRLRTRAARLIRQLDAGTAYRELIEKEIARRVGQAPRDERPPETALPARACSACGKLGDPDAKFCKHCGAPLESAR